MHDVCHKFYTFCYGKYCYVLYLQVARQKGSQQLARLHDMVLSLGSNIKTPGGDNSGDFW